MDGIMDFKCDRTLIGGKSRIDNNVKRLNFFDGFDGDSTYGKSADVISPLLVAYFYLATKGCLSHSLPIGQHDIVLNEILRYS